MKKSRFSISADLAIPQAAVIAMLSFVLGAGSVYGVVRHEQRQHQSINQNQLIEQKCQASPTNQ
ncbi:MAG: hypothetical protein KME59_22795 [Trichormus sp. ATA11-4-KO1]|jgi:hypothetical protein|nr:hypothetical protein [Trichormus sp. ATA11-4-KO1]